MTTEWRWIILLVMTLARLSTVRPSPERRHPAPARAVAAAGIPLDAPLDADGLLRVQQTAGNAAAREIVQRQPQIPGMEPYVPGRAPSTGGGTPESGGERRTLRYGDTGDDVKTLQMKLGQIKERERDRDESGLARIDGIFGPLTREDVIEFQADTGLDPDGVVGPRTWNALDSLVPASQDEAAERELDHAFMAAIDLELAGRYDEAIAAFEAIRLVQQETPENANSVLYHMALCNQQRGRFGIAVSLYEQGLAGRFNQEERRGQLLENLARARTNQFLDSPPPAPEQIPAEGGNPEAYAGGGIRDHLPARDGDTGSHVDLFKGKLLNLSIAWPPPMEGDDLFEITAEARTEKFQRAVGLPITAEADAATWHALDSFMPADVPYSVVVPFLDEVFVAYNLPDPAGSAAALATLLARATGLGLLEIACQLEGMIGERVHDQGRYEEALGHYERFLKRVFPPPNQIGPFMENILAARERRPRPE